LTFTYKIKKRAKDKGDKIEVYYKKRMRLVRRYLFVILVSALIPPIIGALLMGKTIQPVIIAFYQSPTPSPLPTQTITPTQEPSPTQTPIPTQSPTPRPTATPTPTIIPVTSQQLDAWFTEYSNHYSIERRKLWLMAVCESNLKPHAINGDYGGLYQFSTNTWISTRRQMNADPNPQLRFNAEEAIKTAAFKISTVGLSAWPNCNK
jgi:hypothetical protein